MVAILKHIKEQFGQGHSKAKLQKDFFLMEQKKQRISTSLQEGWNNDLRDWECYTQVGMTEAN